jgi:early secretory antigenic target protein ESAT-6
MTRYQVDSEAVLGATSAAKGTIGRIQGEVGALHGQLTNLQASWSGPAASAFQGAVIEWKNLEQRVEEVLSAMGTALGQAGQQYAEIEAANTRLFAH